MCGIWPLTSYRNAEFMVNELRVPVPEHYMERMRRADNAEAAMVAGVQLSAPFGRYSMAIDVAQVLGRDKKDTSVGN